MSFPTDPGAPVPHLDVNADTGNFVYAIAQLPPGKAYMAEGTTCGWSEYLKLLKKVTGIAASYKQVTSDELIRITADTEFGRELAYMFEYSSKPGYDGGDPSLLKATDIRKVSSQQVMAEHILTSQKQMGIDCPTVSLEEWMMKEDWSHLLKSQS